jgi:hypothetical protein
MISFLVLLRPALIDLRADEGYLAELTARTLQGEIPHLDFAANYPGLFYAYNAFWMHLLGKSLWSMRMGMLLSTSLFFIPLVYWHCRRLCLFSRFWSTVTTLGALGAVSLNDMVSGNWPAFFLCFAAVTFAVQAEQMPAAKPQRLSWILSALALTLAFWMKYSLAVYTGFALFYFWLMHTIHQEKTVADTQNMKQSPGQILAWLGLILIPFSIYQLLSSHFTLQHGLFYLLPAISLSLLLGQHLRENHAHLNFRFLLEKVSIFSAVFAGLSLLFSIPYLRDGKALEAFKQIFIIYPQLYLTHAYVDYLAQNMHWSTWSILLLLSLMLTYRKHRLALGICAGLAGFLFIGNISTVQDGILKLLNLLGALPLFLMLAGSGFCLYKLFRKEGIQPYQSILFFWIWASLLFLNTYPLGTLDYLAYSLSPTILLVGKTGQFLSNKQKIGPIICASVLLIALSLGSLAANRIVVNSYANYFPVDLPTPRSKIHLSPDAAYLTGILDFIRTESRRPNDIFFYYDEPVAYFLTDHQNPTRYSYSFDSDIGDGSDMVQDLEKNQVTYVLVKPDRNHFRHFILDRYLASQFALFRVLPGNVLVFRRVDISDNQ